jgi:hypothetical protein
MGLGAVLCKSHYWAFWLLLPRGRLLRRPTAASSSWETMWRPARCFAFYGFGPWLSVQHPADFPTDGRFFRVSAEVFLVCRLRVWRLYDLGGQPGSDCRDTGHRGASISVNRPYVVDGQFPDCTFLAVAEKARGQHLGAVSYRVKQLRTRGYELDVGAV